MSWHRAIAAMLCAVALTLAGCVSGADAMRPIPAGAATAIFAGGCFWCVEFDFEKLPGVYEVESGYTGGQVANPTYYQVAAGGTGHTEAVRVYYDPTRLTYAQLLDYFWRHIDPTVKDQQFCDHGEQYRSGIYWQSEAERTAAEASRDALLKSGRFMTIYTEIAPAGAFYRAEEYHQDYYRKNPIRYSYYRAGCGRDARLAQVWGGGLADAGPGTAAPVPGEPAERKRLTE